MKDKYTEITAENWEQFKGMKVDVSDIKLIWYRRRLIKYIRDALYPVYTDGGTFKHARIKNVDEADNKYVGSEANTIQIPSNLTKAEAEEALKKASEDKVELNRWYLVTDYNGDICCRYLDKNKIWFEYKDNDFQSAIFDNYKIIAPMYTWEEFNQLSWEE